MADTIFEIFVIVGVAYAFVMIQNFYKTVYVRMWKMCFYRRNILKYVFIQNLK